MLNGIKIPWLLVDICGIFHFVKILQFPTNHRRIDLHIVTGIWWWAKAMPWGIFTAVTKTTICVVRLSILKPPWWISFNKSSNYAFVPGPAKTPKNDGNIWHCLNLSVNLEKASFLKFFTVYTAFAESVCSHQSVVVSQLFTQHRMGNK